MISINKRSFFSVFFQEVRANLEHRLSHSLPHQDPNVLIELYNSAVEHLELVCMQVKNLIQFYILQLLHFPVFYHLQAFLLNIAGMKAKFLLVTFFS